jgi:hypothetical protein
MVAVSNTLSSDAVEEVILLAQTCSVVLVDAGAIS